MFFSDPSDWLLLSRALGFAPHAPVAGYGSLASFRQLKRAMGPPASGADFSHWLYGTHKGREGLITHYSTGSGRNRSHWTAVVARVDPPLFLGVHIAREMLFSDLFGGSDVVLGLPAFDAELRLGALDPGRLRELLVPHDPGGLPLLQALVRTTRDGLQVSDSTAVWQLSGLVTDIARVARALDEASWIAAELSRRRAEMQPTPAERAVQGEWRAFADSANLAFDPLRMKITGELRGARVEVALETNGGRVQTAVTVRWPRSLGVALRVRKAHGLAFLSELFGGDIKTGDALFDDMFHVQGHPELWVRQALASAGLRNTLRSVAAHASEVTMDHEGAFWLWPAPAVRAADLEAHVSTAQRATEAIFGAIQGQGPYR